MVAVVAGDTILKGGPGQRRHLVSIVHTLNAAPGPLVNQLPSWLQAIAALATAGFAFAMYRITREYVKATKDIAVSTATQVELMRASLSSDAKVRGAALSLRQHLTVIREFLDGIPAPSSRQHADGLARSVVLVPESHLEGVLAAAIEIGVAAAESATRLVQSVRWLRERMSAVQATSRTHGFDWQRFDWERWDRNYLEASIALRALIDIGAA